MKGAAAAALATLAAPVGAARAAIAGRRRIVVVGAGITGASIAYHLAKLGADVLVLEREAGPGMVCTQGAFASLIASHDAGPRAFNTLYEQAVLDWRRLQAELGGAAPVQWGGMVHWAAPGADAEALAEAGRRARLWGSAILEIDARDIAALAPGVVTGEVGAALFRAQNGAVNPLDATHALVAAAEGRGARFEYGREVRGVRRNGAGIESLETNRGRVQGDVFVFAVGAATERFAGWADARVGVNVVSGTLAHSYPHPRVLHRVLNGPAGSIKQDPDGRIVTGLDYRPGADGTDVSRAYGAHLLELAAGVVPALSGARLEKMTIGHVALPADSTPIVGFCAGAPNTYLALSMSGITMAPLLGRLIASEISEGLEVETFADYRPSRFG